MERYKGDSEREKGYSERDKEYSERGEIYKRERERRGRKERDNYIFICIRKIANDRFSYTLLNQNSHRKHEKITVKRT